MLDDAVSDEDEKADRAMRERRLKHLLNDIAQVPVIRPTKTKPEDIGAIQNPRSKVICIERLLSVEWYCSPACRDEARQLSQSRGSYNPCLNVPRRCARNVNGGIRDGGNGFQPCPWSGICSFPLFAEEF